MPRSRYLASVTLEYASQAPTLDRLEVEATKPHTAVLRALRTVLRQHPGTKWQSLVVVLERTEAAEAAQEAA